MENRSAKYHVFFTAIHIKACIENGRFGATSINSLVDVLKNDKAFIYDGKESKLYGPFTIVSNEQFHELDPIYGRNKKDSPRYVNRIAFSSENAKVVAYKDLYCIERDYRSDVYVLNRSLLSIIVENKQVHSMPLTTSEGVYLERITNTLGKNLDYTTEIKDYNSHITIREKLKSTKSTEAFFETSLMINKPYPILNELFYNDLSLIYNQFVIGIQRQIDILAIHDKAIEVFELKRKDNPSDPFQQLLEYSAYLKTDYRMFEYNSQNKDIHLIALLEQGNIFLQNQHAITNFQSQAQRMSIRTSIFEMSVEKTNEIKITPLIL